MTIFSWDSRLGGSMTLYQQIVFYNNGDEVKPIHLDETATAFDSLFVVNDRDDNPIYLIYGHGKSSNYETYDHIVAYIIEDDKLVPKKIFPNKKPDWIQDNLDSDTKVGFKIENNAQHILKPQWVTKGVVWQPYAFDGTRYTPTPFPLDSVMTKESFAPNNDYHFLNGSELPIGIRTEGQFKNFHFNDSLRVSIEHDYEHEITSCSIFGPDGSNSKFKLGYGANLIGKKHDYLFFTEGGVPESWSLHIYNIKTNEISMTNYVAEAKLLEDYLLFSNLINEGHTQEFEPYDCDTQYGHFGIWALHFMEKLPLIQATSQSYCAFIQ